MINTFVERLVKLGITIELIGNYPWIYLYKVNGNKVTEKFMANHGFTAFILKRDGSYSITDRSTVFNTIRKYR